MLWTLHAPSGWVLHALPDGRASLFLSLAYASASTLFTYFHSAGAACPAENNKQKMLLCSSLLTPQLLEP